MRVTFHKPKKPLLTTSLCEYFEILSFPIWCMENPWIHALTLSRASPAGCLRLSALIWLGQLWHLAHTRAHTLIQAYTFFSLFPMHLTISCYVVYADESRGSRLSLRFKLSLTCSAAETVCMSPVTLLPCLVYKQIERPCRCQLNFLLGSFDDI